MACVGIPRKEQLRIFKLFDEDGDQKIDLQEWRSVTFCTYHFFFSSPALPLLLL